MTAEVTQGDLRVLRTDPLDTRSLERDFVASVLLDPTALDDLAIPPEDFSDRRASAVLTAELAIHGRGEEPDLASLRVELDRAGKLEQVGHDYLVGLTKGASLYAGTILEALTDRSSLRRLRHETQRVLAACQDGNLEAARELVSLLATADDGYHVKQAVRLRDAAVKALAGVCRNADQGKAYAGTTTGLRFVDWAFGGLDPGQLAVLGAGTGVGKSRCVLTMARGAAERGVPCGIVPVEDAEGLWGMRFGGSVVGVSPLQMRTQLGEHRIVDRVRWGIEHLPDPDIYIDEQIGKSEHHVLAAMRRLVSRCGVRLLFVDYLQAIKSRNPRADRKVQVADITSAVKAQAHALGVPVVLVSQFSRKLDDKHEPRIGDLKESGDIENAAELILLLWPSVDDKGVPIDGSIEYRIGKGRHGARSHRSSLVTDPNGALIEHGKWGAPAAQGALDV